MAAMVSQIDAKVGQFVEALQRTGQSENTLIIFTSDNGGIESLKNAYAGEVPDSPFNSENDHCEARRRPCTRAERASAPSLTGQAS